MRPISEYYAALQKFIDGRPTMSVPPEETDTDIIISEAFERLQVAEARVKELETAIGELLAVLASYDKKGEHKELFDRIIRM